MGEDDRNFLVKEWQDSRLFRYISSAFVIGLLVAIGFGIFGSDEAEGAMSAGQTSVANIEWTNTL